MAEARFEGRRALVTGAGSGIGEATARALHAEGADVVLADAVGERVEALAGELGARARPVVLDVRDEDAVAAAVGGLDVLVNVAGVGSTTSAPETPLDVWENVFAVNARGTFLCCKHAIPGMVERGGGAIVNIASVAGLVGLPNRAAYCASKGAVIALTRAMAIDHVYASPLPAPRGRLGDMPLPAPASVRVLSGTGAVFEGSESSKELVTPTGAAILAVTATFERPALELRTIGYGLGARETAGNALAAWVGEEVPVQLGVTVIETNLDDMAPNLVAALVEIGEVNRAREMCETAGVETDKVLLEALIAAKDEPAMKRLIDREKARAKGTPVHTGSRPRSAPRARAPGTRARRQGQEGLNIFRFSLEEAYRLAKIVHTAKPLENRTRRMQEIIGTLSTCCHS